jgi:hypothetical protein
MDLNSFFKLGFCVTQINKIDADRMLEETKKLNFIYETKSEGYVKNQTCLNIHNQKIESFWQNCLNSTHFFGNFSFKNIIAHRYKIGEAMEPHNDVLSRAFILNILYLTEHTFTQEDGGELIISQCNILPNAKISSIPRMVTKILPNHGTLVTINNLNPCILHEVSLVKSDKIRIALSCQAGFLENIYGQIQP